MTLLDASYVLLSPAFLDADVGYSPMHEVDENWLIPDDKDLFDGTITREMFITGGEGFVFNALIPRARLGPGDSVLDMGSGNGQKSRVLTKVLSENGRYCGFDVDKKTIDWCSERYWGFKNFSFIHSNVKSDWYNPTAECAAENYKFPYPDNSFDVAFAASLFTHLQPAETANYLSETGRVLKPGGRLFMTCFMVNQFNNGKHAQPVQGNEFVQVSDLHWHLDTSAPSRGVAYDEAALRGMIGAAGLVTAELYFGRWSNPTDGLGMLQDAILVMKPPEN